MMFKLRCITCIHINFKTLEKGFLLCERHNITIEDIQKGYCIIEE